jgi:hypothetical protein
MTEQNPEPAEMNLERLLSEAYQPEAIDVEFTRKTVAYLEKLAAERRALPSPWRFVAWLYLANAMAILLLVAMPPLFWHYFIEEPRRQQEEKERNKKEKTPPTERTPPRPRTQSRSGLLAVHFKPLDLSGFQRVDAAHDLDPPRGGEILDDLALARHQSRVMAHVGLDPGGEGGVLVLGKVLADVDTVDQLAKVPLELSAG